jgi:hypothetical protein
MSWRFSYLARANCAKNRSLLERSSDALPRKLMKVNAP